MFSRVRGVDSRFVLRLQRREKVHAVRVLVARTPEKAAMLAGMRGVRRVLPVAFRRVDVLLLAARAEQQHRNRRQLGPRSGTCALGELAVVRAALAIRSVAGAWTLIRSTLGGSVLVGAHRGGLFI